MSFLAPLLLVALPLALLPVVIHLLYRRRHRTIEWAAMRFLLEATRAARGWQRLRHLLILASRVVALAALLLAISRPIAGGWLGFAAGERADAVLILLDRSESMGERDLATGRSKLAHGIEKLAEGLSRRPANQWVLLDPLVDSARVLDHPGDLRDLPLLPATATATDIARLFERAIEYVRENQVGRTEVWVLTDAQATDWSPESGRWPAIRDELAELSRVRVYLLAYRELAEANLAVRVGEARRRDDDAGSAVELDVEILSRAELPAGTRVPLEIALGGATTVTEVEISGSRAHLEGHSVPIDATAGSGWGFVGIGGDARPGDDRAYFAFGEEPVRRTLCVAEDAEIARIIAIATRAPRVHSLSYESRIFHPDQVDDVPWSEASFVVWQAPLPAPERSASIEAFVARGGSILFLPPEVPTERQIFGVGWERWLPRAEPDAATIPSWQTREDLLANTDDGEPLPVEGLRIFGRCALRGGGRTLARFDDGTPALVRGTTEAGGAYFLTSPPLPGTSNLAQDGVVLYALLHRALEAGVASQRAARQREAGTFRPDASWQLVASDHEDALSTERFAHAGVFRRGEEIAAVNRPDSEDSRRALGAEQFAEILGDADWVLVEDSLAAAGSLLQETWRLFLGAMLVALLVEAMLCWFDLPRPLQGRKSG